MDEQNNSDDGDDIMNYGGRRYQDSRYRDRRIRILSSLSLLSLIIITIIFSKLDLISKIKTVVAIFRNKT